MKNSMNSKNSKNSWEFQNEKFQVKNFNVNIFLKWKLQNDSSKFKMKIQNESFHVKKDKMGGVGVEGSATMILLECVI